MEVQLIVSKQKQKYIDVFSSPSGQEVLKDIILSGLVEQEIFDSDPIMMAHSEGRRCLALHIKSMAMPMKELKKQNAIT